MGAAKKKPAQGGGQVRGEVVLAPLADVQKNPWNPNRMSTFMRESLKRGIKQDGWIASQALLVWGTDENGAKKNLIIDGEHRWSIAREMGYVEGPMVFLKKITEAQAKSLTVKMNQKRGEFDDEGLAALLTDVGAIATEEMALDLGIAQDELLKLLAPSIPPTGDVPAPTTRSPSLSIDFPSKALRDEVKTILAKHAQDGEMTGVVLNRLLRERA